MPSDVLELGRTIVRELDLEPSVDTLGRWMSHHIAELINSAEFADTQSKKRRLEQEAVDTICKVWARRSEYQNRINPVHELEPVINITKTLAPDSSPWVRRDQSTYQLYDTFRRLIICQLLRRAESIESFSTAIERSQNTTKFQSEEEKELLSTFATWMAIMSSDSNQNIAVDDSAEPEAIDLDEICMQLVEQARRALDALESQLKEDKGDSTS